jgi:thiaminase
MSKVGKALKKLTLVYKTTSSDEFIDYMKPKLQHFVRHNFVARLEDKHFKKCIKHFPSNVMVYVVDFVKNYSFEMQNKVQSMHWHTY